MRVLCSSCSHNDHMLRKKCWLRTNINKTSSDIINVCNELRGSSKNLVQSDFLNSQNFDLIRFTNSIVFRQRMVLSSRYLEENTLSDILYCVLSNILHLNIKYFWDTWKDDDYFIAYQMTIVIHVRLIFIRSVFGVRCCQITL